MKPGYKPICLFSCLLVALFASPAHAGTLADALEQAWQLHREAGALDARLDEANTRAELAGGLIPGPAALSLGHLNDSLGSGRGKQEWEVELAAPLWLPGQKAAQSNEAASFREEVAARRVALRLELAGELRAAWWALAAARQADALAQRRLNTARNLESEVQRRYRVGDLARVDANHARGESLAAEAERLHADAAVQQAERAWRDLTGMSAPARLEPETLAETNPQTPRREMHPSLAAVASAARLAHVRLKLAHSVQRESPEIALRVLRERADYNESFGNAIGLKLTIPFKSDPRARRDDAAARADATQAEAELLQATRRLEQDVAHARRELANAERQWQWAQERRDLTADTLGLAEKTFSLGESDLTALLRARAAAYEAEALFNRQETARGQAVSRLKQALGEMP